MLNEWLYEWFGDELCLFLCLHVYYEDDGIIECFDRVSLSMLFSEYYSVFERYYYVDASMNEWLNE